jgi:branched-chain amino acid transport system ATP-binding protein
MAALVELCSTIKRFGGVTVIDDLSLAVDGAEAVGVLGPNGAGKTTMLNLVAGDLRPDRGSVRFGGRDVTGLRTDQRCRLGIARTSQIPRPFVGLSVFENVLAATVFGTGRPLAERTATPVAVDALERTGLLAFANARAGTLTLLGRKRLELAKALATTPELLLLDEIAGGLTEVEVLELVATITSLRDEGLTIVWIEHIVHALLAVVRRLVVISFGRLIADGEPAVVMADPQVQELYMGVAPDLDEVAN